MNDRLAEIKRNAAAPDSVKITINQTDSDKKKLVQNDGSSSQTGESKFMKDFFGDVEIIKEQILIVRDTTSKVTQISQEVDLAASGEREQELTAQVTPLIDKTNKCASRAKQLLQRLREDTERQKSVSGKVNVNEIRIRENLINTLTRKFVDVMKEYQNAQQKFKTDIKKKMKRQIKIVQPEATNEELEEAIQTGAVKGEIFKNAILQGGPSDAVRNATLNVANKYQEVLNLEKSCMELHEMFMDFALLTEQQGEMLDQIEFQVKAASDFIDDGNVDLGKAIEYQISIRKKQCCILVTLLVVIGIILAIVFTMNPPKK